MKTTKPNIINVIVENKSYPINCEFGTQDVAWLAISACYIHGRQSSPQAQYIPILVTNKKKEVIHPKLVIFKYKETIGDELYVKIQRSSDKDIVGMTKQEKEWYNQAFKKEKYMMNLNIKFFPVNKDYHHIQTFFVKIKYDILPAISHFPEYRTENILDISLPRNPKALDTCEAILDIPYGEITVLKIYYKESEDSIKEVIDTGRNKLEFKKFPDPLLAKEKELFIKNKELEVLNEENELRSLIKQIEKEKMDEEIKIDELRNFLDSMPFTMDEIYDMTILGIPNSETEIDPVFKMFHDDDFDYFKKLYMMFEQYSLYYDDDFEYGEFINLDAFKHFFITYFDKSKVNEYESINITFKNFHLDKKLLENKFRFNDSIHKIIESELVF